MNELSYKLIRIEFNQLWSWSSLQIFHGQYECHCLTTKLCRLFRVFDKYYSRVFFCQFTLKLLSMEIGVHCCRLLIDHAWLEPPAFRRNSGHWIEYFEENWEKKEIYLNTFQAYRIHKWTFSNKLFVKCFRQRVNDIDLCCGVCGTFLFCSRFVHSKRVRMKGVRRRAEIMIWSLWQLYVSIADYKIHMKLIFRNSFAASAS